jgi:glycosyltransferase involved in cell wall biosynthesis
MRIGFDAKRAFFNRSGLGNYSRSTVNLLKKYFPNDEYVLYTPSTKNSIDFYEEGEFEERVPKSSFHRIFSSIWRSVNLTKEIKSDQIDIFHGLSNELPLGIQSSGIKSIVTIHDLIFLRYPEYFKRVDREIYKRKFKNACLNANCIIAISDQTKNDIIDFYGINKEKIEVVYQGCNPLFREKINSDILEKVRKKFSLPSEFILDVGTIEPRKNMRLIVEAHLHSKHQLPIVLIGKTTDYIKEIKSFILNNSQLEGKVFFLHGVSDLELRAIYQLASIFVYPSFFEGFGIPILEALCSKLPVVCSAGSCFEETAGRSSVFFDPNSAEDLAKAIDGVLDDTVLYRKMQEMGWIHSQSFTDKNVASNLMNVYQKVISSF